VEDTKTGRVYVGVIDADDATQPDFQIEFTSRAVLDQKMDEDEDLSELQLVVRALRAHRADFAQAVGKVVSAEAVIDGEVKRGG